MWNFALTDMEVANNSDRFWEYLYLTNGKRDKASMKAAINNSTNRVLQATRRRILEPESPAGATQCLSTGERRCEDGTCIARVELCPEEQLMNQNTILIMIVVGLAVVLFLVILYCFQQRQRRANRELGGDTGLTDDCDNASLYAPPPPYEDVVNSNLYPATLQQRRLRLLSADDEPISPLTPPPNYDTALVILAQSQDSVLSKPRRTSSLYRRSVSLEQMNNRQSSKSSNDIDCESLNKPKSKRTMNFFRFSRQFSRTSATSSCHSPSLVPNSPPPYPQTPPVYPLTPPPPFTPTYHRPPQTQLQNTTDSEMIS